MKKLLLTALVSAMCVTSSQAANVISLNFESWGNAPTGATPTAGLANVPYWNDTYIEVTRDTAAWTPTDGTDDAMFDLNDSTNAATTMDVAWKAGGTYRVRGSAPSLDTDGTANRRVLNGYLDARPGLANVTSTVTLSQVPYSSFDLYVYFNSDTANRAGSITVNGENKCYFKTMAGTSVPTGTANAVFVKATAKTAEEAIASNYVFIEGISASTDTIIVTDIPQGGGIAAIQVVENIFKPTVTPNNGDGTFGTPTSATQAQVSFSWNAMPDPNTLHPYPVLPSIVAHNVYMSNGNPNDEPNMYLIGTVTQVHNADPALTNPANVFGPATVTRGAKYYWQIEEVINSGNGTGYPAGSPNNIRGPLWTFNSVTADAGILTNPANALADASGNASFTVVANAATVSYAWFKVGSPDVQITDGGVYSGATTATLTITGATAANDGQYYCIAYNSTGKASNPSAKAKLWTRRLMSHFTFDSLNESGAAVDSVSGFTIVPTNATAGGALPVLAAGMPEMGATDMGMSFTNNTTPAGTMYGNATAGIVDYKDITISAWVLYNGGGNWQRVIDCGVDTNNYIFISPSSGSNTVFAIKKGGTEITLTTPKIADGVWSLITATLNGNTARLYINGELKATNTSVSYDPVDLGCINNYIGKSQWPDPYLNGIISDLKIYSYARSTEDIAQDYLDFKGEWICDREHYNLTYDFDNNCRVDVADFAKIAATWMNTFRIYPTAAN